MEQEVKTCYAKVLDNADFSGSDNCNARTQSVMMEDTRHDAEPNRCSSFNERLPNITYNLLSPKKDCPLEMSIRAANLADEFETSPYLDMHGGGYITNAIMPIGVAPSSNIPNMSSVPGFASDGRFEFTLQPTNFQVVLLQVPHSQVINESSAVMYTSATMDTGQTLIQSDPQFVTSMMRVPDMRLGSLPLASAAVHEPAEPAMTMDNIQETPQIPQDPVNVDLSPECNVDVDESSRFSKENDEICSDSFAVPSNSEPEADVQSVVSVAESQLPSETSNAVVKNSLDAEADEIANERRVESMICEVDESGDSDIVDSEEEPLVLKIRRVAPKKIRKPRKSAAELEAAFLKGKEQWETIVAPKMNKKRGKSRVEYGPEDEGWSASDEESLAKIKEDEEYRTNPKLFRRAVKCCHRRCHVKIHPNLQESVFKLFVELEEKGEGDKYLANCVQLTSDLHKRDARVFKQPAAEKTNASSNPEMTSRSLESMSAEIANECNGNPSLSDEIQNAIRESLRDQEVDVNDAASDRSNSEINVKLPSPPETQDWAYFIAVNLRLRAVCLKFLLSVLRISQSRIDTIKSKILDGSPLDRLPLSARMSHSRNVWQLAKRHLDSLPTKPVPYCRVSPPHFFLSPRISRPTLFQRFREFHLEKSGANPNVGYDTYRRFLVSNTCLAFRRKKETTCACCDALESQAPYHGNSGVRGRLSKGVKMKLNDIDKEINEGDRLLDEYLDIPSALEKHDKKRKSVVNSRQSVNGMEQNNVKRTKTLIEDSKRKSIEKNKQAPSKNGENNKNSVVGCKSSKANLTNAKKKKQASGVEMKRRVCVKRGDVFSLMLAHLRATPSVAPKRCQASPLHRYFDPASVSIQWLYDEYRKYFLRETNSELGLRFAIYESLVLRNPVFAIGSVDVESGDCPRCLANPPPPPPLTARTEAKRVKVKSKSKS